MSETTQRPVRDITREDETPTPTPTTATTIARPPVPTTARDDETFDADREQGPPTATTATPSTTGFDVKTGRHTSAGNKQEEDIDKYSILFLPSTPRASPVRTPVPLPPYSADPAGGMDNDRSAATATTTTTATTATATTAPHVDPYPHPYTHPRPRAHAQPQQQHKRTISMSSEDSDFGNFVSVSAEDDPLSSTFSTFGDLLPMTATTSTSTPSTSTSVANDGDQFGEMVYGMMNTSITGGGGSAGGGTGSSSNANQSLNFFDKFAQEAKNATDRKRKSVLEELLVHEDDPMYFLRSSTPTMTMNAASTTTNKVQGPTTNNNDDVSAKANLDAQPQSHQQLRASPKPLPLPPTPPPTAADPLFSPVPPTPPSATTKPNPTNTNTNTVNTPSTSANTTAATATSSQVESDSRLDPPPDLPLLVDLENDVDADYFHPRHASRSSSFNSPSSSNNALSNSGYMNRGPGQGQGRESQEGLRRSISSSPVRNMSLPIPTPPGLAPPVSSSPEIVYSHLQQRQSSPHHHQPHDHQHQHGLNHDQGNDQGSGGVGGYWTDEHRLMTSPGPQPDPHRSSSYQSLTSLPGKWMSSLLRGSQPPSGGVTSPTGLASDGTSTQRPTLDSIFSPPAAEVGHGGNGNRSGSGSRTTSSATNSLRRTMSNISSSTPSSSTSHQGHASSSTTSSGTLHSRSATHPHSTTTHLTPQQKHAQSVPLPYFISGPSPPTPPPVQFTHVSPFASSSSSSTYTAMSPFASSFASSPTPGGGSGTLPIPGTTWSATGTLNAGNNPFGAHTIYVAPSGAPGFKGDMEYDWDRKGWSDELGREWEREKRKLKKVNPKDKEKDKESGGSGGGGGLFGGLNYSQRDDRETTSEGGSGSAGAGGGSGTRKEPGITSVGDFIDQRVGGQRLELVGRKASTAGVLNEDLGLKIRAYLPALHRLSKKWSLIYSLDQHGISLNTLYTLCEARLSPTSSSSHSSTSTVLSPTASSTSMTNKSCLLIIKDADGALFGAWLGEGLARGKARSSGSGFFGSGESFLWRCKRDDGADLKMFKTTGRNNYIALCDVNYLALGGGDGSYGLYLDQSLYDGSSAPCPTFGNEVLCSPGPKKAGGAVEFECVGLEVWGMS